MKLRDRGRQGQGWREVRADQGRQVREKEWGQGVEEIDLGVNGREVGWDNFTEVQRVSRVKGQTCAA